MSNFLSKKIVLVLATAGALTGLQAQRIANVNVDSLLTLMPETKTASSAAEAISRGLNEEMTSMQTEFEAKYKDYMENEATMSDLLKKTKQEDLRQLEQRTADFRTQAQQEYQRKTAELTAPIMEKAKKAIAMVAKENGFRYVLDTSPQTTTVLYADPAEDIMALVKKKLDSMPLATIPGGSNTEGTKAPLKGPKPPAPSGK